MTVDKITRKEGPGLSRHACGMPCVTSPSPHLLVKAGGRGTAESPPSSPPHPHPIWDSSLTERRIFVTASGWRSRAEKLILDRDVDRSLPLPFFDWTLVSRDIDCLSFGENK
jgi:hypothetical protein